MDANVLQGKFNHDVSLRFGVTRDGENFFIRHRVRFIAKQFSALRNRDRFRLWLRTIEYVHGAPLNASRDDSCCARCALRLADLGPARQCTWSADAGVAPTAICVT